MIKKYHTYVGLPNNSYATAWCSSFVSWCLKESNIDNPKTAASRFYLSDDPKYKKHSASLIKRISSSSYGALALYSDCSSTGTLYSAGHIGIVYGFITDEKTGKEYLALLGGNQGERLKVSRYDFSGNVFHSYTDKNGKKHYKKFRGFYWPIKGGVIPSHVPKDNYFKSATEANKKILNQEIKDSKNGESSR